MHKVLTEGLTGSEQGLTPSEQKEYGALRATIGQRGTARVLAFAMGLAIWAALSVATFALAAPPIGTLVPLVALAGVFEAVYALHVAVERIGRYLSIFHDDNWERVIALFGRPAGAIRLDPLFSILFLIAAIVNLAPLLPAGPTVQELTFVGGAHALFVLRVISARAAAKRQRVVDAGRFEQIRSSR